MLLPHGASMGSGYGPMVVAPAPLSLDELRRVEIAVPGAMTTAFLVLRMVLGDFSYREVPFDQILDEVRSGRADAGLVIHEGQLTYEAEGLAKCLDLGEWWLLETGLPLPLGVNVARRDLGRETLHDALGGAARVDRDRAREPRRGDGLRAQLRPRARPRPRRSLRRHVRERAHVRLRRRGPPGGGGAAPPGRGDRRVPATRCASSSSPDPTALPPVDHLSRRRHTSRVRPWHALVDRLSPNRRCSGARPS